MGSKAKKYGKKRGHEKQEKAEKGKADEISEGQCKQ